MARCAACRCAAFGSALKQTFGRGFVRDQRVGGYVEQGINGPGASIMAADQAAAFVRSCRARVVDNFREM